MSDIQSLLFYITGFTLSAVLVHLGSLARFAALTLTFPRGTKINLFTLIGLTIPILIGGLLHQVGIDYDGYIRLFEKATELSYTDFLIYNDFWTVEPSFYIIAQLSMLIVNSSWVMFGVYSAINILFFYLFLKRFIPEHKALGFFIYLFVFFLFTMTLMRQGAAISVCLFALTYLLEKKYIKYLVLIATASLIHFSALFFLITLPLSLIIKPLKPNWIIIALLASVGLVVVASPFLIQTITSVPPFDKYAYLLTKTRDDMLIGWTFLLQLSILGGISVLYYKIVRQYSYASLLYCMLLIGIIAYTLNFRVDYASRLAFFFLPVSVVLLSYSLSLFKNNRILTILLLLGCVAYFVKIYYIGNTLLVFPYNFIWSA